MGNGIGTVYMCVYIFLNTALISLTIPDLPDLISLVGAVSCTFLGLIVPPVLYTLSFWEAKHRTKCFDIFPWPIWLGKNIITVLVGTVGLVLGVYASFYSISRNFYNYYFIR